MIRKFLADFFGIALFGIIVITLPQLIAYIGGMYQ